jgi:hypothetical protein
MASNCATNAAPNRVPERWFISFEKKRHRAFRELRLATLAKLIKREADFARNHGTMPRKPVESLHLKPTVWRSWEKQISKVGGLTPPGQANKSLQANWQARFLINRIRPAKAHSGGVISPPLPIA